MEEVFPHQPGVLCSCYGHDDLHDGGGPPNRSEAPSQRHTRGQTDVPLQHVPGETAPPWPVHHEPALLPLLSACAGNTQLMEPAALIHVM